jgi:hypothetical protein
MILTETEDVGFSSAETVTPVKHRSGFYDDEGGWRWMSETGRLLAPASAMPAVFIADLACGKLSWYDRCSPERGPLEVTLAINGQASQKLRFDADMQSVRIQQAIPASTHEVLIELFSNKNYVPAQNGINQDQRRLSVRLSDPQLHRLAVPGAGPPRPKPVSPEDVEIAALRRELAHSEQELAKYRTFRPPGHFYSPVPDLEEVRRRESLIFGRPSGSLPGIALNEAGQLQLLKSLSRFYRDQPFSATKQPGTRYYFDNPNFGYGDALALYCMIRQVRPGRIIEVGSGYSSCVTLDTNDVFFGGSICCTFIEPFPELFHSLVDAAAGQPPRMIPKAIQDVDISIFHALQAGDILFIDSTHVSKTGSDVNRVIFEILPALAPGVYIHFHDVFYPFEYPKDWVYEGRAWNEDYLLRAFLQYNQAFQIQLFNSYLATEHASLLAGLMPLWTRNTGASIWLKKL